MVLHEELSWAEAGDCRIYCGVNGLRVYYEHFLYSLTSKCARGGGGEGDSSRNTHEITFELGCFEYESSVICHILPKQKVSTIPESTILKMGIAAVISDSCRVFLTLGFSQNKSSFFPSSQVSPARCFQIPAMC